MGIQQSYAVFGLGRYGLAVAKELVNSGAEVLAVFMILAILNLFCFMVLEQCFPSAGIPFRVGGQTQTLLVYSAAYSMLVNCLGYLALGVYLSGRRANLSRCS